MGCRVRSSLRLRAFPQGSRRAHGNRVVRSRQCALCHRSDLCHDHHRTHRYRTGGGSLHADRLCARCLDRVAGTQGVGAGRRRARNHGLVRGRRPARHGSGKPVRLACELLADRCILSHSVCRDWPTSAARIEIGYVQAQPDRAVRAARPTAHTACPDADFGVLSWHGIDLHLSRRPAACAR